MKRYLFLASALMLMLACKMLNPTQAPTAPVQVQPPTATVAAPATETPLPPEPPTATPEPAATPTLPGLTIPTPGILPEQWNGTYTYPTGQKQRLSLLIEKVKDGKFEGKMIWASFGNSKGAILKMNGEYVTSFGDGKELARWKNHEDYSDTNQEGTWLKWTETAIIDGANYTVNGWYYAHIREDGKMIAMYFYNKDETVADVGRFVFELVTH